MRIQSLFTTEPQNEWENNNNKTCKPSCHFRAVFTWSVRVRSLQRRYTPAYRASHPVQIYTLHLFSFNIHTHNAYFIMGWYAGLYHTEMSVNWTAGDLLLFMSHICTNCCTLFTQHWGNTVFHSLDYYYFECWYSVYISKNTSKQITN